MPSNGLHDWSGPEDIIAYCARVSNPANQDNLLTAPKLIKYLIRKSHWSPFEMVDVTFEIVTSRAIARQILRHRSFSFQEFSTRYAEVDTDKPIVNFPRKQDHKNRQNSIPLDLYDINENVLGCHWREKVRELNAAVSDAYTWGLEQGLAKECVRDVLMEGVTPTRMYMKGSMRSWFHYCLVRMHPGTQKEHRDIAEAIWKILQSEFSFAKTIDMPLLAIAYQNMFEHALEECIQND